jgi:hyperosmotically inducible periplasmic protein
MRNKSLLFKGLIAVFGALLLVSAPDVRAGQRHKGHDQLESPGTRDVNRLEALKEEVRHQLVTLPYYSVFDWLEAQVRPDGAVVLMGETVRPTLKDDAESRVKRLEGVTRVINNIEVLPLSPMDDQLRVALYRRIYNFDSPLFRYATWSVPPIHIIVKNGHVTLKGIVANEGDSQLAYMAAQQVPNVFDVKNELQIEQSYDEKVSRK